MKLGLLITLIISFWVSPILAQDVTIYFKVKCAYKGIYLIKKLDGVASVEKKGELGEEFIKVDFNNKIISIKTMENILKKKKTYQRTLEQLPNK